MLSLGSEMSSLRELIAKRKQANKAQPFSSKKPSCLPLPTCAPGEKKVTISHVHSPFEIYLIDLVNDFHKWQKLSDFCDKFKIEIDSNNGRNASETESKFKSGDFILVYDENSEAWLRGNVIKVSGNEVMEVFIPDYGYTFTDVPFEQCREFPENTPLELVTGCGLALKFSLFQICRNMDSETLKTMTVQLKSYSLENNTDSEPVIFTAQIFNFDAASQTASGSLKTAERSLLHSIFNLWTPKISFPCIPQEIVLGKPFYGTLTNTDGPSSIFIHPHNENQLNKLRIILTEIGKVIVQLKDLRNTKRHFRIGQYVLAKYSDENFYRAQVFESNGFEDYRVYFVDYGSFYSAKFRDIHPLPAPLVKITPVGFRVKLANVLSRSGNQTFGVFVDRHFSQLTSLYSKIEGAFEFTLTGPCDDHGTFPCEIQLVKPVDQSRDCSSLHEELGLLNCGALMDISHSQHEIYTKSDLFDSIDFSSPQVALTYNILPTSNSVTVLLHSNLNLALNDLMEIKISLMHELKPFKRSYNPGDLVLFENNDDGDEIPFNRGYVLKYENKVVVVHGLELNTEFVLPTHRVIPYLKSYKLPANSVYKCRHEEKLPNFSKSEKEILVEIQFDPVGKKWLDSNSENLSYVIKNIRIV